MRSSIATVCLSGTLAEKLRAAADAGFDGVEIFEQDLIVSPHSPEQIRERAAELGLTLDLFQPFRDLLSVEEDIFRDNLRRLESKFQLMQRLGMDQILVCSNVATATVDDDEVRVDQLRRAGELAARYGCFISYEALAWGKYVNTYQHAYDLVVKADHPNVGTCLDSFHILSRGDDPSGIADMDPDKIFFLQLADAPTMEMGILPWSRHHRVFPGEGDFDLKNFMEQVAKSGYNGPVSLEIFNDEFREAEVGRTAIDGLRSLIWLADKTATRVPDSPLELPKLADAQSPRGFDFVELRTGRLGEVTKALHQLGFRLGGYHQSKPEFQAWVQGDVRIIVEDEGSTGGATELTGLGVIVDDATAAAERATALKATPVPRMTGEDEEDLHPVYTPDGSELYFCGPGQTGRGSTWIPEFGFEPDETSSSETSDVLINSVHHIALAQPRHMAAETRLFYSSVLGLEPAVPEFIPSPAGLVHKQAIEGENVCITVSAAPEGSEQGGFFAEHYPEHIAFGSDDVFAVAQRAVRRGLKMLPIPENYYDDLAARFGLEPGFITKIKALNICYDRSSNGEYLHFYTAPLGNTFFEVAEVRGDYRGFGWADEPIRLAAQYRALRDDVRGIPR
ncbi:MAG: TIM barrel protein [Corynebacterium casei]|uniref:sugar phosphate isomerase/epimerase and 4-hydroxyphenylpyruvate domain-containing protein n=1 Tax=Corynebacterium casei TaxID=160386 RepID=UPI0026486941|nr:sugar phosphate isomerase/epimerase and 4-hydroxyphenylpyruvate domain-containing protein [Corynebacterium casei]MDN5840275.1 TIM barrel protein [Corynebacterium casei]